VQNHKADAHAPEESDRGIVSTNRANKEEQSSAEPGKKRGAGQGEHCFIQHSPDTGWEIECARDGAVYEEQSSSSLIQGGSRMRENRSYGSVRGRSAMVVPAASLSLKLSTPSRQISCATSRNGT
jgi:hypothetical protein